MILHRLLLENYDEWQKTCDSLIKRNKDITVPSVNDITTLHNFNVALSELYTETSYYFALARQNRDAIKRIIENTLKDYYKGKNDAARKAAGVQYAQKYPVPESAKPFYPSDTVNLFDLEDKINGYYYILESIMKSLEHKASAKITSN